MFLLVIDSLIYLPIIFKLFENLIVEKTHKT